MNAPTPHPWHAVRDAERASVTSLPVDPLATAAGICLGAALGLFAYALFIIPLALDACR